MNGFMFSDCSSFSLNGAAWGYYVTQGKVDGQQSLTFRIYLMLSNIHSTIFFLFKPPVVFPAD